MSKQLTSQIPAKSIAVKNWTHLEGLNLADPTYNTPGSIDLLLGVREYAQIVQQDIIKGPPGTPCAQKTSLGWILFGEIDTNSSKDSILVMHHQVDVEEMLKTIWEIDTDRKRKHTREEQLCEDLYNNSYTRNEEGRYVVKLPFKTKHIKSTEGNTREVAMNRLLQQEKMFRRLPERHKEYVKVIDEYKTMKHIEKVPLNEIETKKSVYAPHFAVIREGKESTSVRVVYDFSAKGSNGVSLNDELLLGPTLQDDLRSLIIRWRMHKVCFVSDIEKMYRMILIAKEDADFQRILWRACPTDPIEDLRLLTVTFGTASAPYLAIKTLLQLATDEGIDFPLAANVVREDFYVDDLLSGCDDIETAVKISKELQELLSRGGFKLKKWASNNADFMRSIEPSERSASVHLDMNVGGTTKALSVVWDIGSDRFQYNLNFPTMSETITKRTILSDIQKLYDPLGWIAPAIVSAKMLIQKLWQEKVNWDEDLNEILKQQWLAIRTDLENVNEIQMDRWLDTLTSEKDAIQIHGFSDASMNAYAAVVYCRVKKPDGSIKIKLIAARTRIAPLKTVSLPRLELCGAVLLSELLKQVSQAMRIPSSQVFAWTDSSIVLSWLLGDVSRWKLFVANRVVEILENVNGNQWYHVMSKDNPADIASRGMLLKDLKDCQLWWEGPEWLSSDNIEYRRPNYVATDIERKKVIQANLKIDDTENNSLLNQIEEFDDLSELTRCIAWCRRFLKQKEYKDEINNTLTTEELEKSLLTCIKLIQEREFSEEIDSIKEKKEVKSRSCLKSLNPYLDDHGILRVGGRLRHANLDEDTKHPIILSNNNKLTSLVIADAHFRTMHGGVQLMLCYLRSKYWIIRAKGLVKKYIHKCLICAKQSAAARTQLMGDLPKQRVTPSRPFSHSGVDFAGPLQ
ncbi:uncharacterized protein LOC114356935, partial [Ostrinia furnacalis]|uniref:uncharacterized protein LOC114356935 n=1 Tax=Ostrinia furnacalis TaxID=93504 RepID=UPI001038E6AF